MSNDVLNLVYRKALGSSVRKSILVYLADRASDNGSGIWASKPTIAAATECGVSTVIRTIGNFVSEGILIKVGHSPCQGGATIVYAMDLERVASLPDAMSSRRKTPPTAGPLPQRDPSRNVTPPLPQRDPHPSRSGTQTILEPSFNLSLSSRERENDEIQSAFEAWNALANRAGLSKAEKLTKSRRSQLAARLRDVGGLSGWEKALERIEASPFLMGQTAGASGSTFQAKLDWVLKEANFIKLMEGNYAKRSNPITATGGGFLASASNASGRRSSASIASFVTERRLRERG